MRYNLPVLLLITTFSFLNISCAHHYRKHKKKYKKNSLAVISPVNKSTVQGWVRFHKQEDKTTLVTAEVKGLAPNKKYGFHIHKYGDCRENGKNAGSHLNPYDNRHGSSHSEERHTGDLGNLVADKKGNAVYKNIVDICAYKTGGRSVLVHANEDDFQSQPAGNAGPYIGCGVIGYVHSPDKHINNQNKEGAWVVPYSENGKLIGFRLKYIKSGSIYEKMGLKVSDTIISINKEKPKSSSQASELVQKAKTLSKVNMTIKREEKYISLSYPVKKAEKKAETPKADEAKQKAETPKADEAKQKTETPKADEAKQKTETPKADEVKQKTETPKADEVKQKTETPKADEAKQKTETPKADEVKQKTETPKADEAKTKITTEASGK